MEATKEGALTTLWSNTDEKTIASKLKGLRRPSIGEHLVHPNLFYSTEEPIN
jgi:hypothetical protein